MLITIEIHSYTIPGTKRSRKRLYIAVKVRFSEDCTV